jgi:RNA polymerase sigma-70 factor (ECF subfamily)
MDRKKDFINIIKTNEGLIFKVAGLYTNSDEDRDDLVQEIVYQLWKSFDTFNEQSKLSTWMYRVALNTAIFQLNKTKRTISTIPIDKGDFGLVDDLEKAEEERIKQLYEQIQKLNLLEKGIVLLYLEGKSHEEIATITGLSISNVGTRLSRIREKMKTEIHKTR